MLAIGLMSGTSMDGVDAALLETDGERHIQCQSYLSLSYDSAFQSLLKFTEQSFYQHQGNHDAVIHDLHLKHRITLESVIQQSTSWHQLAIEQLLQKTNISSKAVAIVGYHGQTVFHNPTAALTIQLGNSQILANSIGIPVVSHFRQNDMLHGGQGAPFAPLYHQALAMRDHHASIAMINCGGIANITLIMGSREEDILAFDTGPGNALLDRFLKQKTAGKICMDLNGEYGLQGKIHTEILDKLFKRSCIQKNKNYFMLPAPKSLDINDLQLIPELMTLSLQDACATLAAFTAHTIIDSVLQSNRPLPRLWVIAGGGAKNPVICRELSQRLSVLTQESCSLKTADEMGWNAQSMEAELFAWLAVRSLKKLPLSIPQTTGVSEPVSGGILFTPQTQQNILS